MLVEVQATIGTKTLSMCGIVTPDGAVVAAISLLETMAAFGYRKSQLFTFAGDVTLRSTTGIPVLIDPGDHFA